MNIVNISLSKIRPDETQARRFFDEGALGALKRSIQTKGIKVPLTLEMQKDGTYLIIDGERRYRSAKDLGLKEVPATLEPEQNNIQRRIERFHIQQLRESWTSVEMAIEVGKIVEDMESTVDEVGKILGINSSQVRMYTAFYKIIDKKSFERSRIGVKHAMNINSIRLLAKKVSEDNDLEFNRTTEKLLENAIYKRIANGAEPNTNFFTKIKDSFVQQPETIEKFIENDKLSVEDLFKDSKAKGAQYLRKISNSCKYLTGEIVVFMKEKSVKVDKNTIINAKTAQEHIKKFLAEFDE